MNIRIRRIKEKNLSEALFADFSRHQEVTRAFRARGGKWAIKDVVFIENWGENEKKELVRYLANTIKTRGIIYGAFDEDRLVGFMSVESKRFGSKKEYVELSSIHVDSAYRGKGIGKRLFECAVSSAESLGAKKLYISAHSAVESQAFYRKMGCVEALEFNPDNLEKEPCDCQLEYVLPRAGNYMATYMCLGMAVGMIFGMTIFNNMALGMCLGMAAGIAVGASLDASEKKKPTGGTSGIADRGRSGNGNTADGSAAGESSDGANSAGETPLAGQPVVEGGPTIHEDNWNSDEGSNL